MLHGGRVRCKEGGCSRFSQGNTGCVSAPGYRTRSMTVPPPSFGKVLHVLAVQRAFAVNPHAAPKGAQRARDGCGGSDKRSNHNIGSANTDTGIESYTGV